LLRSQHATLNLFVTFQTLKLLFLFLRLSHRPMLLAQAVAVERAARAKVAFRIVQALPVGLAQLFNPAVYALKQAPAS